MPNKEMLCIGHRGAMGHAPENTIRSVRRALELNVKYIEVDVFFVDGELLVFHDERLERTTNGSGYLCDHSFEVLRTLDAGEGERIPTLAEVCDELQSRASINIELKGPGTAEPVASHIAGLLAKGWDVRSILVSSFNHRELAAFTVLAPEVPIGVLLGDLPLDDAKCASDLTAFSVHASLDGIDARFVEDAHRRGLKVFVYTVNHPDDIERMHQLGVDGVFTNLPENVLGNSQQGGLPSLWIDEPTGEANRIQTPGPRISK
jgi:glycerophosphoryl diester phosphodiesterase